MDRAAIEMARGQLIDRQTQEIATLRVELQQRDLELAEMHREQRRLEAENKALRSQVNQQDTTEPC